MDFCETALTPEYIPAPNDLCVTATGLTFNWRETEITAWVDQIADSYSAVTVTEDAIPGIKAEMANLNGIIKQLSADRIAAVKSVSGPIKEFEDKVKALCDKINGARDHLASQVKAFEERARGEKRQQVLFAIETLTAEAGYPGLEIPVQDAWLNKTQKPKATADAIKAIIADHIKSERDAAAMEQAKKDRAASIEKLCEDMAGIFGVRIVPSEFLPLHDLTMPLAEVGEKISAAFALAAQTARQVPPAAPVAAPTPAPATTQAQAPLMPPTATTARKSMDIRIEFEATNEDAVRMALRHLKTLCTAMALTGPEHIFLAGAPLAAPAPRVRSY